MPVRVVAVVYTDLFRGIPTILLVLLLGFGMPALQLQGIPTARSSGPAVALMISYGAYVAEVFRAGIESIHPSQVASAEALGLSRAQTLRYVVVPQAVRRVVPPLLNDFVSLQKDTALVAAVGRLRRGLRRARLRRTSTSTTRRTSSWPRFFVVMTVPLARFTDWLQRRVMPSASGRVRCERDC